MATYAAIMAGGTGTRLWPTSREGEPKQLHAFISDRTLIQETVADIAPIIQPKNILIVTNERYRDAIADQVPRVKHYLIEPFKLGKLLAIGAAAHYLYRLDPQAVMVLLWADSFIGKKDAFIAVLKKAVTAAKEETNSIIGVQTTYPATQYGYIELGAEPAPGLFRLKSFREKPDLETAKRYVKSGRYVWNPGISVWRVDRLLALYGRYQPDHARLLKQLAPTIRQTNFVERARRLLASVEKPEIEDTIYRQAKELMVIPADIGWDDVGHWGAIKDLLQKEGNVVRGKHIGIDTENSLIHGYEKLIATIGLKNIIVIETADAILIADKAQSQKVKDVVEKLKELEMHEYL